MNVVAKSDSIFNNLALIPSELKQEIYEQKKDIELAQRNYYYMNRTFNLKLNDVTLLKNIVFYKCK